MPQILSCSRHRAFLYGIPTMHILATESYAVKFSSIYTHYYELLKYCDRQLMNDCISRQHILCYACICLAYQTRAVYTLRVYQRFNFHIKIAFLVSKLFNKVSSSILFHSTNLK